jgi:PAT family beta-lactamase induction signal transducer AmpG
MQALWRWLSVYGERTIIRLFFLGFSSGLPLALTASTLTIWLTEAQVEKAAIGLFAAVATPYALKFLWSPLMDGVMLPLFCRLLGRRRGWLIATQAGLVVSLIALGFSDPETHIWHTVICAFFVVVFSASQDIVIDAYRVEILPTEKQGAGAAAAVLGYRFGMIASGAGALFLAQSHGWQVTYMAMAALMGVGILTALLSPEPENVSAKTTRAPSAWLRDYVVQPFADFMTHRHWLALLCFIMLYKFADAFMGIMTGPFLIETGFTKVEIGTVVKLFGLWAAIAGSFAGGALVFRLGLIRSLWICGIAQMFTNLAFVGQVWLGVNLEYLAVCISLENFCGGMGTAAFVAFLSRLCNRQFTATQYALLSSVASLGRTLFSSYSGVAAGWLGWEAFFIFSTVLALPALVLLRWLQGRIDLK